MGSFGKLKSSYLLLLFFSVLFFGCYSTYRVSEFPSKQKFFDNFNKSVKNRTIRIVLTNDSSLIVSNGAEILNDSLFFSNRIQKEKRLIPKSEIKNIQYSFESYNSTYSANIILNNDEKLNAENVELLPDSSVLCNVNQGLSLTKVKYISYKNRLLGGLVGFFFGIPSGLVAGELISLTAPATGRGGAGSQDLTDSYLTGIISVPIIGAVLGLVNGITYKYDFTTESGASADGKQ